MGLLEVSNLTKRFGGVEAISDVSFQVEQGMITTVLGPNGAGKTSLFNLITGVLQPTSGVVRFQGQTITGQPPSEIARRGVARTFQKLRLFKNLSVEENVTMSLLSMGKVSWLSAFFGAKTAQDEEQAARREAHELLDFVGLAGDEATRSGSLAHGRQRLLEIARALALHPQLLLLDEPMAGLNPEESERLAHSILRIRERGITVLLIEHHVDAVMDISDRIVVIDFGKKVFDGLPEACQVDPRVIAAYLGGGEESA